MPHVHIDDQLDLYYESHGDLDAATVVLIRGTGADSSRWMPQVEAYRDEFRVVIFDNRGVGRSTTPPGPYRVADMADDTVKLLDALGVDECHLSGSSLGGAIALKLAIDHPSRVASLQLHSSWLVTHGYTSYSLGLLKQILERDGPDFYYEATLPLLFSAKFLSSDHERLQLILANMRANSATYEGLLGQIEANLSHDLRGEVGAIRVPTLVTVGELDSLVPVIASEELAASIPGAELVIFDDAGHLATMEAAERFNAVTLEWLRRVSRQPV